MNRVALCLGAAAAALFTALFAAPQAHADDDDAWTFEMELRFGSSIGASPHADPDLTSSAGLEASAGPRFVSPSGWGLGLDMIGNFDLDGDSPGYVSFITDTYVLHRFSVADADFVTLRLGPSFWLADADMLAHCADDCPPEVQARKDAIDLHDSVVLAGVAGLGVSHALGPFMFGVDVRARVGRALADDASPLRAQALVVLSFAMRVPPSEDYASD